MMLGGASEASVYMLGILPMHAWYTRWPSPPVHESEQSEVSHELALPEPPVSPGASSVDFAVSERSSVGLRT